MDATTAAVIFDDPKKRFSDFALKDYELKVAYLTNHFQRMWTRFNYFVVVESALIGGRTLFGDKDLTVAGIVFGIGLSAMWYVMGAEDRFLVQLYRKQLDDAAELLADGVAHVAPHPSPPVGQVDDAHKYFKARISAFRIDAISTTRLAAIIPLLVTMVWIGMLVWELA